MDRRCTNQTDPDFGMLSLSRPWRSFPPIPPRHDLIEDTDRSRCLLMNDLDINIGARED